MEENAIGTIDAINGGVAVVVIPADPAADERDHRAAQQSGRDARATHVRCDTPDEFGHTKSTKRSFDVE